MHSETLHPLRDMFGVARDGATFYEHARQEIGDSSLRSLFIRMASVKREMMKILSTRIVEEGGNPPTHGTLPGAVRKIYTEMRTHLPGDERRIYVEQLEECEDRILDHLRCALREVPPGEVRTQLEALVPKAQECHDEMRRLKRRMTN